MLHGPAGAGSARSRWAGEEGGGAVATGEGRGPGHARLSDLVVLVTGGRNWHGPNSGAPRKEIRSHPAPAAGRQLQASWPAGRAPCVHRRARNLGARPRRCGGWLAARGEEEGASAVKESVRRHGWHTSPAMPSPFFPRQRGGERTPPPVSGSGRRTRRVGTRVVTHSFVCQKGRHRGVQQLLW